MSDNANPCLALPSPWDYVQLFITHSMTSRKRLGKKLTQVREKHLGEHFKSRYRAPASCQKINPGGSKNL